MPDFDQVEAVIFDYGNTLIHFGREQFDGDLEVVGRELEALYGPCDAARLRDVRNHQVHEPLENGCTEPPLAEICRSLVRRVYRRDATEDEVAHLVHARQTWFLGAISLPDGVRELIDSVRTRYRTGLVSNYPCGYSIRGSLKQIGLHDCFETIVVSGEVGFVKPHPAPFQVALDALGLEPRACLYVGDNWLADVQGAKRLGMRAVHISQYTPYETFRRKEGDHEPDASISHINELLNLLP